MERPTAIDTEPQTTAPRRARPSARLARRTIAATVLAGLLLVGCGDDDDSTAPPGTDAPAESDGGTVEVELVDFAFKDLPDSVPAGTKLTVKNTSKSELHELVAIKLPESEKRSVDELGHLPMEELMTLFTTIEPATVLLAPPGGEAVPAVGDGTLTEPGRYFLVCAIPTGVDPEEYLEAAANSNGGPPQVAGGAPHIAHGMFGELVVEG